VSLLERIVASKRREIASLEAPSVDGAPPVRDVRARLRRGRGEALRLLCEIKLKSPSAGSLSRALTPPERAAAYARAGASMVSVLCDGPFFDGSFAHLADARRALDLAGLDVPLLAKEFVLDPRQIAVARASGADAVLVIVRIVDDAALGALVAHALSLGLEPLVEVADEAEVARALAAGARVIGVNARDLDTLAMDAARAARVLARIPDDVVALHLSGVKTPADVAALAGGRPDGALVGEILMREDDPGALLRALAAAAGNFGG
jgi:indole-3-glycerol phosphate synthase